MAHLTEVRWHDKEGDLGMTRAGVWLLPPSPIPVAEPVRVVVLDCSGITFADAAGAREVVQVRDGVGCGESPLSISCIPANADVGFNTPPPSPQLASRCRDAGIHLLLAQCSGEGGAPGHWGMTRHLGEGKGHGVDLRPQSLTRLSTQPQCWGP